MDYEGLKFFLVVAEQGSFTRASIRMNMTQPAISRRMQRLEEEFNTQLLYRHGRGVSLTEAGLRLKDVAEAAFVRLDAVQEELSEASRGPTGSVTLGLPPSLGASLSVPLARSFGREFPDARLSIVEGFSGTLLEWLDAGKVDIAVLYDARRSPTMLVTPLLRENLYLVEGLSCPPSSNGAVAADLSIGKFALSNSPNGLRRVIDAVVSREGLSMDVSIEIDSLSALKQIVEEGPERSVLPYGAVHKEVAEGKLRAQRFADPEMQALLVAATPLHRQITRLTKSVNALLLEEIKAALDEGRLSGVMK